MVADVGPWYPRFSRDFQASTASWNLEERGAYDCLLDHQWDNGHIPDDIRRVAAILRVGMAQAKRLWWIVEEKFPVCEDGNRRNPRQAFHRAEREEFIAEQARKGKAGADARWHGRGHGRGDSRGDSRKDGRKDGRTYGRKDGSPSPSPSPSVAGPSSSLPPAPSEGPVSSAPGGAHALGVYPSDEMAEAAFHAFLRAYPADGVTSVVSAQRAWAEALPVMPVLAEMLEAVARFKRSDLWRRGKIHHIERWLRGRMWTGKIGSEAPPAPPVVGPSWAPHPGDADPLYHERQVADLLPRYLDGKLDGADAEILEGLYGALGREWPPRPADLDHFTNLIRRAS